jgi:hypothetical protein
MNIYITTASDSVIWEVIGHQVVTANMSSGIYCNIESGSGIVLWHLLLSGLTIPEIEPLMKNHYQNIPENFSSHMDSFITRLIDASIWKRSNNMAVVEEPISQVIADYDAEITYKKPAIITYDDLDTLLQIDPIDDEISELIHAN